MQLSEQNSKHVEDRKLFGKSTYEVEHFGDSFIHIKTLLRAERDLLTWH